MGPGSGDRTRILIDNRDDGVQAAVTSFMETKGYDVSVCGGPEMLPRQRCPLVHDGFCPTAEQADVIVTSLPLDDPRNAEVLRSYRTTYPDTPIVVEIPKPQIDEHADLLEGCVVVPFPYTRATLEQAVEDALAAAAS